MLPFQKLKEFISDIGSNISELTGPATPQSSTGTGDENEKALQRNGRRRSSWHDLGSFFRISKDSKESATGEEKDAATTGQNATEKGAQATKTQGPADPNAPTSPSTVIPNRNTTSAGPSARGSAGANVRPVITRTLSAGSSATTMSQHGQARHSSQPRSIPSDAGTSRNGPTHGQGHGHGPAHHSGKGSRSTGSNAGRLSVGSAPVPLPNLGAVQQARSLSAGAIDSRRTSQGISTLASSHAKGQSNTTPSLNTRGQNSTSPRPAHAQSASSSRAHSSAGYSSNQQQQQHQPGPNQTATSLNSLPSSAHHQSIPKVASAQSAPSSIYTASHGPGTAGAIPRGSTASQQGSLYQSGSNVSNQSILSTTSAPPHTNHPSSSSTSSLPGRGPTRGGYSSDPDQRSRAVSNKPMGNGIANMHVQQREALKKQIQANKLASGKASGDDDDLLSGKETQQYYDHMIAQLDEQIAKAVERGQSPYAIYAMDDDEENDWC